MDIRKVEFLIRTFRRPDELRTFMSKIGTICQGLAEHGIKASSIVVIDADLDGETGTYGVAKELGCETIVSYRNPQVTRIEMNPQLSMGFYGLLNAGMVAAAQNRVSEGAMGLEAFDDTIVLTISPETIAVTFEAVLGIVETFNFDDNALAVGLSLIGGQADTDGRRPGFQPWNAGTAWRLGLFFKYVGSYALMHEKLGWKVILPSGAPEELSGTEDLGAFMRIYKSFPFLHVYILRSMPIPWKVASVGATDVFGQNKMLRKDLAARAWAHAVDIDVEAWMNWIIKI